MSTIRMLLAMAGGAFIGNAMGRQSNNRTWKLRLAIGIASFIASMLILFMEAGV